MKVESIKTKAIKPKDNIYSILDKYLPEIKEGSVLAITSKIISICENRVIDFSQTNKEDLIRSESELVLQSKGNRYNIMLTIKNGILIPNAGIDESNGNGYYILWPKDPQKSACMIRSYIIKKFRVRNFGVIITDSRVLPLRWGTIGIAIAYSGFKPLKNYIGKKDIFGKKLEATKTNIYDSLATSAVLLMGEGSEQTPIALISDLNFIKFCKSNPSKKEIDELEISIKDDLYGELFRKNKWIKVR